MIIGKINKKIILLATAIVVVCLVAVGILVANKKGVSNNPILDRAKFQTLQSPTENSQDNISATGSAQIPNNLPPGVSIVTLRAVNGKQGNASVIAVNDGKNFSLVLEATLADPSAGQNYTAWIAKSSTSADLMMLGKLEKNDGKYSISFSKTGDFTAYKLVVVTLQIDNSDKPQTRVLEGSL